ncbi:MAG: FAD:protein FMN transferase [Acidobacteria bacterium]|nr:MAG: FAD:protein FMN transferase [Acidobacteriota bacterium]
MVDFSPKLTSVIAACLVFAACTGPASGGAHLVDRTRSSMGTELRLTAWTNDEPGVVAAFEAIFREFDRLEGLLSNWQEDSDVQRLNSAAGQHPVRVGTELRDVLETARQVSDWTNGKFDVTFGVMSGLWKFDYQNQDGTIPDHREVVRRRSLINYRDIELDERNGTAFLRRHGMVVNLGGIGKGYAVDRARAILHDRGFRDFLIQFGGDMYAGGREGDRPWKLGIQDPRGPANRIFATVDVSDSTFSTSGDYARSFIKDGRRYHHILDPATGEPSQGCRSVTIMTATATIADGLSTGVFVLGPERGMALIEQLPDVEGIIVSAKNALLVSSGLQGRMTLLSPPADGP